MTARFLRDLEPLAPGPRVRTAVLAARSLAPGERAALLAGLLDGDGDARALAVTIAAACGPGSVATLVTAVADPLPAVRARAIAAAPLTALGDVLLAGSLDDRTRVARRWALGGAEGAADAALAPVRERWGDAEAARLLPACSAAVVARELPDLAHAVASWSRLVARRPAAVLELAGAELAATPAEERQAWWGTRSGLVTALLREHAGAVLDLARRWLTGPLPAVLVSRVHRLLAADAPATVALVLADPERGPQVWSLRRAGRRRVVALPDAAVAALVRAAGPALLAPMLRALPPSRREAVFDAVHRDADLATTILDDDVLGLLPHARRHAEVRRMLGLRVVAEQPERALRLSAFLPFEQARPVLDAATRSPDAAERATAYEGLIAAAAATRDPAAVTAVLAGLDRMRNEQDPVRSRVLLAVARITTALVVDAAVPALDALVRDAVDARDASGLTRSALHGLAFGVLTDPDVSPAVAAWALGAVDVLGAWDVAGLTGPALRALPRGREVEVLARMLPGLSAAVRRGRPQAVLGVALTWGRRAWTLPALQELVGQATEIDDDGVQRRAVDAWLAAPATRAERVAALLARDRSTVTLPRVLAHVVRHDMATVDRVLLAGRPLRGRFGTGKSWWAPVVDAAVVRAWSPARRAAYRSLLGRVVADTRTDRWLRARAVTLVAALDGPAPVDDPDVLLAEAALTGLGRASDPAAALPVLLEHLDGDRARVALYAAGRCARALPPSGLGVLLRPRGKVAARKELARWLAILRPDGALDALLGLVAPGEHRDVRLAALVALAAFPADPRARAACAEAAAGDRYQAFALLAAVPESFAPGARPERAALLRRLARHPDPDVARAATTALGRWVRWAPDAVGDLVDRLTDLADTAVWRHAGAALLRPGVWTEHPHALTAAVVTLTARVDAGPDAGAEQDRPALRRLALVADALARRPGVAQRHPGPVREVVATLATDPALVGLAARVQAGLVGPGRGPDLRALAGLVGVRPVVAAGVAGRLPVRDWEPDATAELLDAAAPSEVGAAGAGLVAVALVAGAGGRAGWAPAWRDRLRALRAHPDPDVRAAACEVTVTPL